MLSYFKYRVNSVSRQLILSFRLVVGLQFTYFPFIPFVDYYIETWPLILVFPSHLF